ncbi:MAG TPA: hypothetical protein VIH09_06930 [Flavobacterium sp.]|uniref:hypothetical protein n=1 Tax=Flavobacterium sp. TaxID=239 RepID=UPI002F41ECB2
MKKLAFLIIIVLFLKPVFPVIDYAVNYDYISKVLCINKEKPAMHCNGKCHLMKELAKASETEKPISSDKKQNVNVLNDLFVEELFTFNLAIIDRKDKPSFNSKYTNLYSHLDSYSIFHPPTIIS